ncbi:uncharacterized protein EAE97_001434 [Botrytis byssoidea]|uniref:Uncharacterized protein n=1 Tax=Botrytis byssoidea TaxID=139641 RepID=A0A9P5LZ48_9HELO|nr:uncharacterized protein EAE97_001434 [Botrytis byssoidea]KAF7954036.1 hypothetical protein EAE97_001434 [Botrytis byssoidea]
MNSENTGFETNETVSTFQTSNSKEWKMRHQCTINIPLHPLTRLTSDQATSSHPSHYLACFKVASARKSSKAGRASKPGAPGE